MIKYQLIQLQTNPAYAGTAEGKTMLFFKKTDINQAVEACRKTPDGVLLDVREEDEFLSGHIPGAESVPLSRISGIRISKQKALFVYCLRGTRSKRAVGILKQMGYTNARSIGGIAAYKGRLEHGKALKQEC